MWTAGVEEVGAAFDGCGERQGLSGAKVLGPGHVEQLRPKLGRAHARVWMERGVEGEPFHLLEHALTGEVVVFVGEVVEHLAHLTESFAVYRAGLVHPRRRLTRFARSLLVGRLWVIWPIVVCTLGGWVT